MSLNAPRPVKYAVINAATVAEHTIVAAVVGKSIVVVNYTLIAAGAVTLTWKSNTSARSGPMAFAANGGVAPAGTGDSPLLETAQGEALILSSNALVQVSGHVAYVEV